MDVLEDMKPKGRVRFASGGVGNDIKYIIELPAEAGADSVSLPIATSPSANCTVVRVPGLQRRGHRVGPHTRRKGLRQGCCRHAS